MAILKLQLDTPIEATLAYAKGKYYESKFPGQDGQLMYTLASGECIFLPGTTDELFASKNIGANEPIVLCLRKTRAGSKYLDVHKLSDATEVEAAAPSKLESQLAASITHVEQQRKALASKLAPPAAAAAGSSTPQHQNNPIAIVPDARPRAGSLMASALVAAIDACIIAHDYADSKGFTCTFAPEDIRAIAATLYIQHSKDPQYAQRQGGRP